jgi:hypothetical protein
MINIKKFLNLEFYTSPLDLFLAKLRKTHPNLSASQRREKDKYADIFHQGDHTHTDAVKKDKLWDKF